MSGSQAFMDAVKSRRSIYPLTNKSPISDDQLEQIIKDTVLNVPSSFNVQSTRVVVLLKKEHETFWDMVKEVLEAIVPAEQFEATSKKLAGFRAGYGTALFFEDPNPIHDLQNKYAIYADRFFPWSEHSSGMHQYVLWTALELEGFGCNLQHYNPIIDQKAQTHWKIPQEWSLKAQLVFGGKGGEPSQKTFQPLEERLFIHGK